MAKLDVNPKLVAGLIMGLDWHGLDVLGVHPVNIDVY
jgi:hypothetical protein